MEHLPVFSAPDIITPNLDPSVYFKDKKRKIDYVMVWSLKKIEDTKAADRLKKNEEIRNIFLEACKKKGLELEEEVIAYSKDVLYFVKVHCPFTLLSVYAESLCYLAPVGVLPPLVMSGDRLSKITRLFKDKVPNLPPRHLHTRYRSSLFNKYVGHEDPDLFFSSGERLHITFKILERVVYGETRKGEMGLSSLVHSKVFTTAFGIHDGYYEYSQLDVPEEMNFRQLLYMFWGSFLKILKFQPLQHIRYYYGPTIALYFSFLGHYIHWLGILSFLGILCQCYGFMHDFHEELVTEVCKSNQTICPVCDQKALGPKLCTSHKLYEYCDFSIEAYRSDSLGNYIFGMILPIWGFAFIHNWRRKQVMLSHSWGTMKSQELFHLPRPQYSAKCSKFITDPFTGETQPYFNDRVRSLRQFVGGLVFLFFVFLAVAMTLCVILTRIYVGVRSQLFFGQASISNTMRTRVGSLVHIILVKLLSFIWRRIAKWLTDWETYRTEEAYENALTLKRFAFQFCCSFSLLAYSAFLRGKLVGTPDKPTRWFGVMIDWCPITCLHDVTHYLLIYLTVTQIVGNAKEILWPRFRIVMREWRLKKENKNMETISQLERDYYLHQWSGINSEYLEITLVYCVMMMFGMSLPLAPLMVFCNSILEIRVDSFKLITIFRRPVPERTSTIGVWDKIWVTITMVAIVTNAFIIAFSTEAIQKLYYYTHYEQRFIGYFNFTLSYYPAKQCYYRDFRNDDFSRSAVHVELVLFKCLAVIVIEHLSLLLGFIIVMTIPSIPEETKLLMRREFKLENLVLVDDQHHEVLQRATEEKKISDKKVVQKAMRQSISIPSDEVSTYNASLRTSVFRPRARSIDVTAWQNVPSTEVIDSEKPKDNKKR